MPHEPLSATRLTEIIATHVPKTEIMTWNYVTGPVTFCAADQNTDNEAPEWPCELLRLAEEVQAWRMQDGAPPPAGAGG